MRNQQQVLVFGDDGSPSSDAAWLWINNHRWNGWRLDRRTASTVTVAAIGPAREVERVERTPFAEAGFADSEFAFVDGDPRILLERVTDADLMVVGSRGHSSMRAAWIGSTTSWLMRNPVAPLAIVKHGHTTRSVVIAADGSAHADAAIAAFLRLPWIGGIEATVVSVDDGRTDSDAASRAAAARLEGKVASVTRKVLTSHVTGALIEAIESVHPDLVVMGTRGLTGWERLTVGSTASAVSHHAPSNLLVACAADHSLDVD